MFVLVVGGGKVGYYLTKELVENGHEVVLMEKDRARAAADRRRARLDRRAPRRLRGQVPRRGRLEPGGHRRRGHRRRRGQPRHLPDGEAPLRRAQDDRPGEQPARTSSCSGTSASTRSSARRGWPSARSSRTSRSTSCSTWPQLDNELEIIEAQLQSDSPAVGRTPGDLVIPDECSLFAVVRDGVATPLRPDTVLQEGDKVIAIGKADCERMLHEQLIGAMEGDRAG